MYKNLDDLYDYWFSNKNIWFNSTDIDDIYIYNNYSYLLYTYPNNYDDSKHLLTYVIIYDQISRHCYRNNKDIINIYHSKALTLSLLMLSKNYDENLNIHERCFLLLPLRHTFDIYYIDLALMYINYYNSLEYNQQYENFIKASIHSKNKLINPVLSNINHTINIYDINNVICYKSAKLDFSISSINKKNRLYNDVENIISTYKNKKLAISLSGGVDSMVLLNIANSLKSKYNIELIAISVNYNNRPESNKLEVEFITRWCYMLNIPLYIRNITEIYREDFKHNNRNFYEKITKEIRFNHYSKFNCPILLGHNKDDCFENIITNIKKGINYNNLNGMSTYHVENNILIIRPLLNISKSEIYEFAKLNKIPHLFTSTPSWSERGKIRDILKPDIEKYDTTLIIGLHNMANVYMDMYRIFDKKIQDIYISILNNNHTLNINEIDKSYIFWQSLLLRYTYDNNINTISHKSLSNLIYRITNNKYGYIILSKQLCLHYKKDMITFI